MENCKFYPYSLAVRSVLTKIQYIIFAIFNFCFCPIIYFFLVETKKRSLEELDVVFAAGGNPVKQEQKMEHGISVQQARFVLGLDAEPETPSEIFEVEETKV